MSERMLWPNLDKVGPCDEVKFVLCDRADYEYARRLIAERGLVGRAACCSRRS